MEKQTLKQLKKGDYFRTLDKNGKQSKETYIKGEFDRSEKKFLCSKCSDIWGYGKYLKSTQQITTEFIY